MKTNKLERLIQNFYEISGMDVAIIDNKNRTLARRYSSNRYCALIHNSPKCLEMCFSSDEMHMKLVKENQKIITYTCPFGIFEAISPIKKNGEVVAYLFLGMGIDDDESCADFSRKTTLEMYPTINKEKLKKTINEIPRYSKKKLEAFASMLPMMAEYIENNNLLNDSSITLGQLVKDYVNNNLSKKITLTDISYNLHFSTVTLTEHFKHEFGITIMDYVMKKRMEKAEQLLETEDLSIKAISEACGFPDIEYFSRSFKSCFGISPTAWRKNKIKNQNTD